MVTKVEWKYEQTMFIMKKKDWMRETEKIKSTNKVKLWKGSLEALFKWIIKQNLYAEFFKWMREENKEIYWK